MSHHEMFNFQEGMLNKLQLHVEKEEIKWRNQLAAKDAEIEQLKETRLNAVRIWYSIIFNVKKDSGKYTLILFVSFIFQNIYLIFLIFLTSDLHLFFTLLID